MFLNFVKFFGRNGVKDILKNLEKQNFGQDKLLQKWDTICKKNGIGYIDFELIRVYKRFIDLDVLSHDDKQDVISAMMQMNMAEVALVLEVNLSVFMNKIKELVGSEKGQSILKLATKSIYDNIQLKLLDVMEE